MGLISRTARALLVLGAWATPVLAADTAQVDSVLDRLEKRLLDQEADGLTFGEKEPPPAIGDPTDGLVTKYKYKKSKIEGTPADAEKIKAVATMVTDLENQVDQLASSVQKTKQGILDDAAIDNFVSLEAELADTDSAALKSISVKLDGYAVYELSEASGLWMPSKKVPLYAGPLQPGNHRVDLEARLVVRHKDGLPLNGDVYRFINKTFDLVVPGTPGNARYVLAITPPAKLDGTADATLKEAL